MLAPYDIVEISERTGRTAIQKSIYQPSFQSVYIDKLRERKEIPAPLWRAHPLRASLNSSEPSIISPRFENTSVPNWSRNLRHSTRSPSPRNWPNTSVTGCYSNNNANAANSSLLFESCFKISERNRKYPVIIGNSSQLNKADELTIFDDSDCLLLSPLDYFCPRTIFDIELEQDNSLIRQHGIRSPFLSPPKFESSHCWRDQIVDSSISHQVSTLYNSL